MNNNLKIEGNSVILTINPKLYPLEVIYSAAYVFLDKAYIFLDGDPEKEVIVSLKPKSDQDLESLGGEFFNELINYADYIERAKQTRAIREMILQRSLITNDPSILGRQNDEAFDKLMEELEDNEPFDDPEGIAIPWEEKYGKKDENNNKAE